MDLLSILLIAIALSMDAFAVSVAGGMAMKRHALKMALSFGSFQAIMPIIGWSAGIGIKNYIFSFDHWIAFFLLLAIGLKMIYEAGEMKEIKINNYTILVLSFATSIDALAAGITLSLIGVEIFFPALIIGVITFFICLSGFFISSKLKFEKAEIVGGIILIALGIKILIEHLTE
ncbi:MAG: hypothetical protein DRN29_01540 [Thermoplasmata archaeon]|nr:MAG: hypothetical protein DRN29_01540 [Thermoplasmata archaeon]HDN95613.1 manganese efflux pump [Thermoplasmatales archaeon]